MPPDGDAKGERDLEDVRPLFYLALTRATKRSNAHRQRRAEHEAKKREVRRTASERVADLRSTLGTAP